ncbi:MAG: hypothetical protein ACXWOX_23130 [Ktedonobacteraceae bacterium]
MSMVVQLIAESLTPAIFCGTHSEGLSEYLSVRIALRRAKLTGRSGDKAGCFSVMYVAQLTVVLTAISVK